MTLIVDQASLREAAEVWRSQGDELRGATASLEEIAPESLGSDRITGAAKHFVDHWATTLDLMGLTAERYADALEEQAISMLLIDADAAENVAGLLAWEA